MNLAATLAVCIAIVAGSCGGESESHEKGDPGGGGSAGSGAPNGATGGTGIPMGGSLATAGTASGGSAAMGGSLATAGTFGDRGGSVATGGSDATGGTGVDGGAGGGAPDPSTEGCRGPQEPGCGTCCQPDGANCSERFSNGGDGYYGVRTLVGPCPASCPSCAQCSFTSENNLRNLGCRADCDCDTIEIGIDPCFGPDSCECYCRQLIVGRTECPHVVVCE